MRHTNGHYMTNLFQVSNPIIIASVVRACAYLSNKLSSHLESLGWELPISWATSDEDNRGYGGPKRAGRLKLIYTSTGPGCHPVWDVREELMRRFLCSNVPQQEVDWRTNSGSKLWEMVSAHDRMHRGINSPLIRATQALKVLDAWGTKRQSQSS